MNDLDQLKELLFGAEKKALHSIAERVERREVRAADVADILPEAIHTRHRKDNELVEALSEPVGQCMQREFRNDPETYADALYPVIGPAIRKSIMHALRNFSQQINEAVEHSISPKGMKWRWQAYRAGVPFGEFILQKTLRYRVEQAYLISRENGLLMSHVHHEASKIKDSDAVSAMFTAIQDFVKESFSPDRTGRLESADMGDFTLWAVHGPHALLVCVIRGVPPRSLRGDLSAILERIHFRYGDAIREYKGDTSTVPDVVTELERCLQFEAREQTGKKRRGVSGTAILMLVVLIAVAVYLGAIRYLNVQQMREFEAALVALPGIHVTEISRRGNHYSVRGLRDPLAGEVLDVAASVGIEADQVSQALLPFQSLDPAIIAARAAETFGRPENVRFEVAGTTLHVIGDAPAAWKRSVEARFSSVAGIDTLDVSELSSSDLRDLATLIESLNSRRFYFSDGVFFANRDAEALQAYAAELREAAGQAEQAGMRLDVSITGFTDATGNPVDNAALATRRAVAAFNVMSASGVPAQINPRSVEIGVESDAEPDAARRYVQIDVMLAAAGSP